MSNLKKKKKSERWEIHILTGLWHCWNKSFEIQWRWQANKCSSVTTAGNRCVSGFNLAPFYLLIWHGTLTVNPVVHQAAENTSFRAISQLNIVSNFIKSNSPECEAADRQLIRDTENKSTQNKEKHCGGFQPNEKRWKEERRQRCWNVSQFIQQLHSESFRLPWKPLLICILCQAAESPLARFGVVSLFWLGWCRGGRRGVGDRRSQRETYFRRSVWD